MLYTAPLLHFLQRKRYQYEVTFSLYMLTPTEKFIFSTSSMYPGCASLKLRDSPTSSPSLLEQAHD